ncbi:hypothetical protein D9619_005283 [Psilocybe cf. subviscida]|uniref:Uncharacterized protein n=1 Tax=Psilocybe cf. subviscida TaxID=2480587 RepID=A0A8H5BWK1_9AGAR|nr:hypothetical protein D9619_005283 [Psilocybe cf. subviscida]
MPLAVFDGIEDGTYRGFMTHAKVLWTVYANLPRRYIYRFLDDMCPPHSALRPRPPSSRSIKDMSPIPKIRPHRRDFHSGFSSGGLSGSKNNNDDDGEDDNNNNNNNGDDGGDDDNNNNRSGSDSSDRQSSSHRSSSSSNDGDSNSSNNNSDSNNNNNGFPFPIPVRKSTIVVISSVYSSIIQNVTVTAPPPLLTASATAPTLTPTPTPTPTSTPTPTPTPIPSSTLIEAYTTAPSPFTQPSNSSIADPLNALNSPTESKPLPMTSILAILMGVLFCITLALVVYVSRDRLPCQCIRRKKAPSKYSAPKSGRSNGTSTTTWRDYLTTTFYTRSHCTRSIMGGSSWSSFDALSRFQFPTPSARSAGSRVETNSSIARGPSVLLQRSEGASPDMLQVPQSARRPISTGSTQDLLNARWDTPFGRESRPESASSLSQYPFEVQSSDGMSAGHDQTAATRLQP